MLEETHRGESLKKNPGLKQAVFPPPVPQPPHLLYLTSSDQDEQHGPVDGRGGEVDLRQRRVKCQPLPGEHTCPLTYILYISEIY